MSNLIHPIKGHDGQVSLLDESVHLNNALLWTWRSIKIKLPTFLKQRWKKCEDGLLTIIKNIVSNQN